MIVVLLHEAEIEFWETVTYYEKQEAGLGVRFKEELDRQMEKIATNPEIPRLRPGGYRRANFARFTHYLAYIIRGEVIWIVAVCHARRRPEFWKDRF